jgi:hypothetical protein
MRAAHKECEQKTNWDVGPEGPLSSGLHGLWVRTLVAVGSRGSDLRRGGQRAAQAAHPRLAR